MKKMKVRCKGETGIEVCEAEKAKNLKREESGNRETKESDQPVGQ